MMCGDITKTSRIKVLGEASVKWSNSVAIVKLL